MTEEKYKNGDMTWNTYSGVFKVFDKDGNEIKFPAENTGYQVKLDVQCILDLCEENKRLKRIEELRISQIENLKQENDNAKTTVEECHKYMAKLEDDNEELVEDNLNLSKENRQIKSALEEIREILTDEIYIDTVRAIKKINEVLDK